MKRKITIIILITLTLLITCLVLLVKLLTREGTVAGLMLRMQDRHYQPDTLTVPPPHPLPAPNGYDTFGQAGKLLVEVPRIKTLFKTVKAAKPQDQAKYLPQMRALVAENAPALSRWRQGFAQSYAFPAQRTVSNQARENYINWHPIAILSQFQARCQASDGNWSGAANSALDVIQFGITVPHGGQLLEGAIGVIIQDEGGDALQPCVPHLTAPQARAVLRRLAKMAPRQVSCADLYQEEMYNIYEALKTQLIQELKKEGKLVPKARHAVDVMLEPYIHYMQRCTANSRLPYPEQKPVKRPKMDPMIAVAAPNIESLGWRCTKERVQLDLLQLQIALHMYHIEHGRYPAALNALAPAYLPALPSDPFARHPSSYIYRLQRKDYVLYSVGGNCRDDGGKHPPPSGAITQGDILDGHTQQ